MYLNVEEYGYWHFNKEWSLQMHGVVVFLSSTIYLFVCFSADRTFQVFADDAFLWELPRLQHLPASLMFI